MTKLKTLKDLELEKTWWEDGYWKPNEEEKEKLFNHELVEHCDCAGGKGKASLKDMKCNIQELRQEAIKWFKAKKAYGGITNADWEAFFNITEEDLR